MGDSQVVDAAVDAAPLPCPLCGYDLRATEAGRCPECGHGFNRAQLRRRLARRAIVPWFVESPAGLWFSGWTTSVRALVPWSFWRDVSPNIPLNADRRSVFALASVVLPAVAVPILWGRLVPSFAWGQWNWQGDWTYAVGPILIVAMLSTVVVAAVFQQTLRRAGIRSGHLWRVAVYSCDFRLLWPIPTLAAAFFYRPVEGLLRHVFGNVLIIVEPSLLLFCGCVWLIATVRVVAAYRSYFRLPAAVATALIVQLVVAVALLTAAVVASNILSPFM